MKRFVYKIYEALFSRPFRRDTKHALYCVEEERLDHYISSGFSFCDDISHFINIAKFTPIRNLELHWIDELDFRRIIRIASRHLITIDMISDVSDLRILSECTRLERIDISTRADQVYLPDISSLSGLQSIKLSLDTREIINTESLKSQSLAELKIDTVCKPGFAVVDAEIRDFSFLLMLPSLRKLTLMVKSKKDPYDDLVTLGKLTELRELTLAPDYFNKEEYAWLSSKLPHTKGLDGYYCIRKDRQKDCIRYIMLGEHEDMLFEDGERSTEYYQSFRALVGEFKNHTTPPKRS